MAERLEFQTFNSKQGQNHSVGGRSRVPWSNLNQIKDASRVAQSRANQSWNGPRPCMCMLFMAVIAYNPGEFYTEHYDNKAGGIVTRAATIVCYLSNCPAGGATYFPKSTGQKSMLEESSVDSLFS
eukprot:1144581-Pelagomonas_calceolata.AAC.11